MDPISALGAASSVIGIAGFALDLSVGLFKVAKQMRSAEETLRNMGERVKATSFVLSEIEELLKEEELHVRKTKALRIFSVAALVRVKETATQCLIVLWKIEATVLGEDLDERDLLERLGKRSKAASKPIQLDAKLASPSIRIWDRFVFVISTSDKLEEYGKQLQTYQGSLSLIFNIVTVKYLQSKSVLTEADLRAIKKAYDDLRRPRPNNHEVANLLLKKKTSSRAISQDSEGRKQFKQAKEVTATVRNLGNQETTFTPHRNMDFITTNLVVMSPPVTGAAGPSSNSHKEVSRTSTASVGHSPGLPTPEHSSNGVPPHLTKEVGGPGSREPQQTTSEEEPLRRSQPPPVLRPASEASGASFLSDTRSENFVASPGVVSETPSVRSRLSSQSQSGTLDRESAVHQNGTSREGSVSGVERSMSPESAIQPLGTSIQISGSAKVDQKLRAYIIKRGLAYSIPYDEKYTANQAKTGSTIKTLAFLEEADRDALLKVLLKDDGTQSHHIVRLEQMRKGYLKFWSNSETATLAIIDARNSAKVPEGAPAPSSRTVSTVEGAAAESDESPGLIRVFTLQEHGLWQEEHLTHSAIMKRVLALDRNSPEVLDKKLTLSYEQQSHIQALLTRLNEAEVDREAYRWSVRQLELKKRKANGLRSLRRRLLVIAYLKRELRQLHGQPLFRRVNFSRVNFEDEDERRSPLPSPLATGPEIVAAGLAGAAAKRILYRRSRSRPQPRYHNDSELAGDLGPFPSEEAQPTSTVKTRDALRHRRARDIFGPLTIARDKSDTMFNSGVNPVKTYTTRSSSHGNLFGRKLESRVDTFDPRSSGVDDEGRSSLPERIGSLSSLDADADDHLISGDSSATSTQNADVGGRGKTGEDSEAKEEKGKDNSLTQHSEAIQADAVPLESDTRPLVFGSSVSWADAPPRGRSRRSPQSGTRIYQGGTALISTSTEGDVIIPSANSQAVVPTGRADDGDHVHNDLDGSVLSDDIINQLMLELTPMQ